MVLSYELEVGKIMILSQTFEGFDGSFSLMQMAKSSSPWNALYMNMVLNQIKGYTGNKS